MHATCPTHLILPDLLTLIKFEPIWTKIKFSRQFSLHTSNRKYGRNSFRTFGDDADRRKDTTSTTSLHFVHSEQKTRDKENYVLRCNSFSGHLCRLHSPGVKMTTCFHLASSCYVHATPPYVFMTWRLVSTGYFFMVLYLVKHKDKSVHNHRKWCDAIESLLLHLYQSGAGRAQWYSAGLRSGWSGVPSPGKGGKFLSSSRPARLWAPPSLTSNGYQGLFPWG
jgi:hypothetical protein